MTTVLKYIIQYKDVLGANWSIKIYDTRAVSADPLYVIGADSPCVVTVDGDENDLFDPIRQSTAKIKMRLEEDTMSILEDLKTIIDNSLCVTVESDKGFAWFGWIIPDQTTRTFSQKSQFLTLTAKDHFSYLKGKRLSYENGKTIYGKTSLMDILVAAFRQWETLFTNSPEVINKSTLDNTAASLFGKNIFQQIAVEAEMFNDENSIPGTGYDVIESILKAFTSFAYVYNYRLHIVNPVDVDKSIFKNLFFNDVSDVNFIIGNDEQMSFSRGIKEVSTETNWINNVGFLKNPHFVIWDEPPTIPDQWQNSVGGVIERVGSGRREDPYAVKLSIAVDDDGGRIKQESYRKFGKGDILTIDVSCFYEDWATTLGDTDYLPIIPICLVLHGEDGNVYFTRSIALSDDYKGSKASNEISPRWIKQDSENVVLDPNPFVGTAPDAAYQLINAMAINPDSYIGQQTFSFKMPALPVDGVVVATVQAARIYAYYFDNINLVAGWNDVTNSHKTHTGVSYSKVILGLDNQQDQVKGEKIYLTQIDEFSGLADSVEIPIDSGIPETLSGSTFTTTAFGPYAVGDHVSGMMRDDISDIRNVSIWAANNFMYYLRNTRTQIELSFLSNEIFFTDLLKIDRVSDGVFLQLKNEYDTKKAKQRVTLTELKGQFKPYADQGLPSETQDVLNLYPKVE